MQRATRIFMTGMLMLLVAAIGFINANLYNDFGSEKVHRDVKRTVVPQLYHLRSAISDGADMDMQRLFPEGYVFLNAFYGLSWVHVKNALHADDPVFAEATVEIEKTYNRLDLDFARGTFPANQPIAFGTFYTGWTSYFLGQKLRSERPEERSETEIVRFKSQCDEIAKVISSTVYPESYPSLSWPADAVVAVSSLVLHDKIFPPKYENAVRQWVDLLKSHVSDGELIPHAAHLNGDGIESARGSSAGLMLIFLSEIDGDLAASQFSLYKKHFLDTTIGLRGIREYPKGSVGSGDVDSGPVILGYGASATLIGIGAFARQGDLENAEIIRSEMEAFAIPYSNEEGKRYLLGHLPMADAFIAWTTCLLQEHKNEVISRAWRSSFQVWSGSIVIVLVLLMMGIWRTRITKAA